MLGDLPEQEFRAALHQAAEWAANYRELEQPPIVRQESMGGQPACPSSIPLLPTPIEM